MGATLTLMVGDGGELTQEADSLGVEGSGSAETVTSSEGSAADESWF